MTARPTVSVIVASHGRPHMVPQVLTSLRYLTYPAFEVILVGDAPDMSAYELSEGLLQSVHYAPCEIENIATAKNTGLRAARGEIVAFLDDDAVPEPDWLDKLIEAFADRKVGLAAGRVRGRDGVEWEFKGGWTNVAGEETPLASADLQPQVLAPEATRFPALSGTNCAFRRLELLAVGGFDESFAFHLEITDAALRMARDGWHTGWVPLAEVHHASQENAARGAQGEPKDPFQLGASTAYFAKRHLEEAERSAALDHCRERLRGDIDDHIRLGIRDEKREALLARLEEGMQEGMTRGPVLPLAATGLDRLILPFGVRLPETRLSLAVLSGHGVSRASEMEVIARALVSRGHRVSFFDTQKRSRTKTVKFLDGLWVHQGFKETALDLYRLATGRPRPLPEVMRVAPKRAFDGVLRPSGWELALERETWQPLRTGVTECDLRCLLLRDKGDRNALFEDIRSEVKAALVYDPPNEIPIPAPPRPTPPSRRSATVSSS
ncbi:MAG: glycosyltransferase family 2 protein [Pseudomonadota bacterium]